MQDDERLFRFDLERLVPGEDKPDAWMVVQIGKAPEYDSYNVIQRYLDAEGVAGRYRVIIYGKYGPSMYEYDATPRTEWVIDTRDLKAPAEVEA